MISSFQYVSSVFALSLRVESTEITFSQVFARDVGTTAPQEVARVSEVSCTSSLHYTFLN